MLLLAVGCEDQPPGDVRGSTTPRYERPAADRSPLEQARLPVRIGEPGPSFAACNAHATTRRRSAAQDSVSVRAAPYEMAAEEGLLPAGASFFVCSRSLDQKWFGIVYDEDFSLAERCGVSKPVPVHRDYDGPCRSGWVGSAGVKLIGR